ncbi:MAG: peptidoglycan-associated lipoprotein, partial [Myxococcales bacterium]
MTTCLGCGPSTPGPAAAPAPASAAASAAAAPPPVVVPAGGRVNNADQVLATART